MESYLAWHMVDRSKKMLFSPYTKMRPGETYSVPEGEESIPIRLCRWGLHASLLLLDALNYHAGPIVQRVECSGHVVFGGDKLVATRRRVLWDMDAEWCFHEYALDLASEWMADDDNIDRWRQLMEQANRIGCRIPTVSEGWELLDAFRAWVRGEGLYQDVYRLRVDFALRSRRRRFLGGAILSSAVSWLGGLAVREVVWTLGEGKDRDLWVRLSHRLEDRLFSLSHDPALVAA